LTNAEECVVQHDMKMDEVWNLGLDQTTGH
jgi:hypothetical protein